MPDWAQGQNNLVCFIHASKMRMVLLQENTLEAMEIPCVMKVK